MDKYLLIHGLKQTQCLYSVCVFSFSKQYLIFSEIFNIYPPACNLSSALPFDDLPEKPINAGRSPCICSLAQFKGNTH